MYPKHTTKTRPRAINSPSSSHPPTSYKHPHHHHTGGFYIVKGVLAFPGLVALVYLCTGFSYDGNAEAEERHEKVIK